MGKIAARSSIALIGILVAVCSAQTGKVEKIGPLADPAVPEAVRQTLDPVGYRISLDDGTAFCDLWLRKSIPAQRIATLQMWSIRNWPSRHWWASCIIRKAEVTTGDRQFLPAFTPSVTN